MRRYLTLILILFSFVSVAQINRYGAPLYSAYDVDLSDDYPLFHSVARDMRGFIYFSGISNIIEYDGTRYRTVDVNNSCSRVVCMSADTSGVVYVAADNDIGFLAYDLKGKTVFRSLKSLLPAGFDLSGISDIYFKDDCACFFGNNTLITFNKSSERFDIFNYKTDFLPAFSDNVFYALTRDNGICRIASDKMISLGMKSWTKSEFFDCIRTKSNEILFANDSDLTVYNIRNNSFDKQNLDNFISTLSESGQRIHKFQKIDNNRFAASCDCSVYIFDSLYNVVNVICKNAGGDFSFVNSSLFFNNQLWITDRGFSKISIQSPFGVFGKSQGLDGMLNSMAECNGKLYVAGCNGLYCIDNRNNVSVVKKIDYEFSGSLSVMDFTNPFTREKSLLLADCKGLYKLENDVVKVVLTGNNRFNNIFQSSDLKFLYSCGSDFEVFEILPGGVFKLQNSVKIKKVDNLPFQIAEDSQSNILFNENDRGISIYSKSDNKKLYIEYPEYFGRGVTLSKVASRLLFCTKSGLYEYDNNSDKFVKSDIFGNLSLTSERGVYAVYRYGKGFMVFYRVSSKSRRGAELVIADSKGEYYSFDKLFRPLSDEYIKSGYVASDSCFWFMCDNSKIISYKTDIDKFEKFYVDYNNLNKNNFKCYFRRVKTDTRVLSDGSLVTKKGDFADKQDLHLVPRVQYQDNNLTFEFAAPFYDGEQFTQYSYHLVGYTKVWSEWSSNASANFTNLDEGFYTFKVKARNVYGVESKIIEYSFSVSPPFYRYSYAYFLYLILFITFIYLLMNLYSRKIKADKEELQRLVKERTAEILQQKEEIECQRDEIELQRDEISKSKSEIVSSVQYASYIQRAVLAQDETIGDMFAEYFLLYHPKDIVAGDFYWFNKMENKKIGVIADCTGHGVPGGFMSMLGVSFLNQYVDTWISPDQVLNNIRSSVIKSLHQSSKSISRDGMDMALFMIDENTLEMEYAGANISLHIVRDGVLTIIQADRMPIGIHKLLSSSFKNNKFQLQKGDMIYAFSDGYADQFGGDQCRKFMTLRMKELMIEASDKNSDDQKSLFEETHIVWRGKNLQTDDILVFGARI